MEITLHNLTIGDVVKNYHDAGDEGVTGYEGKLDIRPPYQREFVYKDKQQEAVIDTIFKGLPLNVMYWVKNDEDAFEVLDGQQRTISFARYVNNQFPVQKDGNITYFHSLTEEEQEAFLDYELFIYVCEGTEREKLEWFETINIAGVRLKDQELRNAVYNGPWVADAKSDFSRQNARAGQMADGYISGERDRQDHLELALKWIAHKDSTTIEDYMALHQHDEDANELWQYFDAVISWARRLFPTKRAQMKTVPWGELYNDYSHNTYNTNQLEARVAELMRDDEIKNKRGIYTYVFDGKEKHLNLRTFTPAERSTMYERQEGICMECEEHFELNEMHADHIVPWSQGGKTTLANGQMLCAACNREKSDK